MMLSLLIFGGVGSVGTVFLFVFLFLRWTTMKPFWGMDVPVASSSLSELLSASLISFESVSSFLSGADRTGAISFDWLGVGFVGLTGVRMISSIIWSFLIGLLGALRECVRNPCTKNTESVAIGTRPERCERSFGLTPVVFLFSHKNAADQLYLGGPLIFGNIIFRHNDAVILALFFRPVNPPVPSGILYQWIPGLALWWQILYA